MDALLQDLRFALRSLRRAPGFALMVVVMMALGIGVNAFMYTAVRAILFANLPFVEPDRIVAVRTQRKGGEPFEMSVPDVRDVMERSRTLPSVAGWTEWNAFVTTGDDAVRYAAAMSTSALPQVLGVSPALGRWFTPDECTQAHRYEPVVIGHRLWREQFAGARDALGRTLRVHGRVRTVVGVMPEGFRFPEDAELYVPLATDDTSNWRGAHWLEVAGRMGPGVTLAQARAELGSIGADLAREYPLTNEKLTLIATPFRQWLAEGPGPFIVLLSLAVLFVLLIACANVASLQLTRATARQREVGVRIAMGATRPRLVRQLVTESVLLSLLGGALGVLLGAWAMRFTVASIPITLPYWMKFELDPAVLLTVLAISVCSGVAFGLAPALHATSGDLLTPLREGTPGGGERPASHRLRSALVVAEVALAVVLLIGTGLMVRSFMGQLNQHHALKSENVLTGAVTLPQALYPDDAARVAFFRELRPLLAALPGVQAVGGVMILHLGGNSSSTLVHLEGPDADPTTSRQEASFNVITPGYLDAVGMPLLRGRDLADSDSPDAPRVCLVNEAAAQRFWPGADPLGRRLRMDPNDSLAWTSVVGVVANVRQRARPPERPLPEILLPHAQSGNPALNWAIRATGDPGTLAVAVRSALRARDANLPLYEVRTLGEHLRLALWEPRLYAQLMGAFSVLALFIAALGIYGVMAYFVSLRTREIGIRMALGAGRTDVQRMVVGQAARLTLFGIGIGLAAAYGLTRFMQGMLFGVRPDDPPTFALVTVVLAASAVLAAWLPAARAVRVDPVVALRHE